MNFEIEYISDGPPKFSPNQMDNELVLISDDDRDVLRTVLPKGEKPVGISPDFISGKGEGNIFLLYGPPGTGKTLTVECVANDTRRPLLTLTAQDLSISYRNPETELAKWFVVAAKWDAILLIDEADLFLEQRRGGDTFSNGFATVFLRTLEYYKGVLFLTTNRPGHIDDSFISRITTPITYKALTPETKAKIVRKFVRKFEETGTVEVERGAASYLIDNCQELNGRQIRNVLQNAVASAEVQQRYEHASSAAEIGGEGSANFDMVSVRLHHVKTAVERQADFRLYLESLKGGRDERARAKSRQDYLSVAWNE
jgi:SpoVK/Ycf46/Vps4 family AAA+-type ATPase